LEDVDGMASLNKVFLLGNLTRAPEVRRTARGASLCTLELAVSRRLAQAGGQPREETCFVEIEVWGAQAESCGQHLTTGAPVLVEGYLHLDRWDDRRTGARMSRLVVRAERVSFVGPAESGGRRAAEAPAAAVEETATVENVPAAEGATAEPPAAAALPAPPAFEPVEPVGESILF